MNPSAEALEKRKRTAPTAVATGTWTTCEHSRFLAAIELFPQGPWSAIAKYVGTRTPRQAQTHAQKYREKLLRQDVATGEPAPNTTDQDDEGEVDTVDEEKVTPQEEINTTCFSTQDSMFDPVLPMDEAMAFLVDLVDYAEWTHDSTAHHSR